MDIFIRNATRFLVCSVLAGGMTGVIFAQRGGGGMMPATPFDPHDVSGYWELGPDGKSVPAAELTPAAKEALNKIAEEDMVSYRWCRPLGLPAMMDNGRPIAIQQGRWELLMTTEANSSPRHIYLNRPQHIDPNIFDPSSVGDSIAHWDGDVLVVDTIGFHEKNGRMLIPGGGYRTTESHLEERYKLLKNGTILSLTFTWTDPKVFRTKHSYEFRYSKVGGNYEPRPAIGCDPWDPERTDFVTRTFSPALKKKAEAALVLPGTPVAK